MKEMAQTNQLSSHTQEPIQKLSLDGPLGQDGQTPARDAAGSFVVSAIQHDSVLTPDTQITTGALYIVSLPLSNDRRSECQCTCSYL